MIDGSPDNSILNLITGYNGLGRIFGSGGGPGGGGGGGAGANFSGPTGALRLFNDLMGGQASWLLPAALVALLAGLWLRRRAPRTDRTRAALLLWGGWLLVTGAVFSFGQGVIHTYYTVALAPAIAALVAIGAAIWWQHRTRLAARLLGALVLAGSAAWACVLLARTPSWNPWLAPLIAVACALAITALLAAPLLGRSRGRVLAVAIALGTVATLSGPLAYAAYTVSTPHTGSIVSAGPSSGGAGGFGAGSARPGAGAGGFGGSRTPGGAGGPGGLGGSRSGMPPGALGTSPPSSSSGSTSSSNSGGRSRPSGSASGGARQAAGGAPGGAGGGGVTVSAKLVSALRSDASSYRWVAATSGSQSAASLELSSGQAVMAIGGFNNEGGKLSLSAFERYVERGEIHYYIAAQAGGGGGPGGGGASSTVASWVKANFKALSIGGTTVYDLTART